MRSTNYLPDQLINVSSIWFNAVEDMNSNFEEIFQGWLEKEEYNKTKGFLKKSKYWKKYFCVLRRYEGDSNVYLQWFDKEEDWRKEYPKGTFGLFPKYAVYKHKVERGKNHFEISNEEEAHYFLSSNERTMDLWVIQLIMQTRLSSSMIASSFRVKGDDSDERRDMQRIGAKSLNCLLHLSEWGMTIALERTHSVLSQWPLTTIRNFECTDNNEFMFEAGRKSPMGEGKYKFSTYNNEDNAIFDLLDHYTTMRARRIKPLGSRNRLDSANDDEIAQAYGQLRWSVMLSPSHLNLGVIPGMPSQPQDIAPNKPKDNHIVCHGNGQTSVNGASNLYNHLDYFGSLEDGLQRWGSSPGNANSKRSIREQRIGDSYDHLERTNSYNGSPAVENRSHSPSSVDGRNRSGFSSPPPEYSRLSRQRIASLPNKSPNSEFYDRLDKDKVERKHASLPRNSSAGSSVFYDKLDRSMASIHQGPETNSYDRLDSMQGSEAVLKKSSTASPPSYDANEYDVFGNLRKHTPKSYEFLQLNGSTPEELPPPLPSKPSFMLKGQKTASPVKPGPSPPTDSASQKQDEPLPSTPMDDLVASKTTMQNGSIQSTDINGSTLSSNGDTQHYQTIYDESSSGVNGSHYQTVDDQKENSEYTEPLPRNSIHSSNPNLNKITNEGKGKLDQSKKLTLHRSAPSLAHYSTVNKKTKGSPRLTKASSTFKLFKKIGRSSKKEGPTYEKIPRRSKKGSKKDLTAISTSNLRQDDDVSYVDVDGEESTQARNSGTSTATRPLPSLPQRSSWNI